MPIYNFNNRTYDIPDDLVKEFEKDNPTATMAYQDGEDIYDIQVNQRDEFLKQFPNAKLYVEQPTDESKKVGDVYVGGIGTQEEADAIFDANAKAIREKYASQKDQGIPESEMQRLRDIKDKAQKQIDEAGFFDRFFDVDTRAAVAARNQAEEALETYEEANREKETWFDKNVMGVISGFADKVGDLSTWDFGASGVASGVALNDAITKMENGGQLTAAEQNMLDAFGLASAVQAAYQDKVGMAYRVGGSLPESMAFGASLAINPLGRVGAKVAETAAKAAVKKYGASMVSKLAKGAARVGGDVAGMAGVTATTGAGRVAEDYYNRLNGQSTFEIDDNGIIRYGGQVDQEEADDAIWKAMGSSFIENYSEAMGSYFAPMGTMLSNLTSKGLKAAHLGKFADVVNDISSSQFSKGLQRFKEATKFDGLVGEYLEEVAGNVMNAATVGDMNFNTPEDPRSVFNPETNIETFLSCALMSGSIYAVEAPISMYNKNVAKKNLGNADKEASELWGDRWEDMRSQMDEADPQHLAQLLTGVQNATDLTEEQKAAAKNYGMRLMQYQGYNARRLQNQAESTDEANEINNAYDRGADMVEPADKHNAKVAMDKAEAALADDSSFLQEVINGQDNPVAAITSMVESGKYSKDQIAKAKDYYVAYRRMNGLTDSVLERVNSQIESANKEVDANTNVDENTGARTIVPVTLRDGRQGYVLKGTVTPGEEGSIDVNKSDSYIVVRVDGKNLPMNPNKDLVSVGQITTPESLKEYNSTSLKEQLINNEIGEIDWNPATPNPKVGDSFEMDGVPVTIVFHDGQGGMFVVPTEQWQAAQGNEKQMQKLMMQAQQAGAVPASMFKQWASDQLDSQEEAVAVQQEAAIQESVSTEIKPAEEPAANEEAVSEKKPMSEDEAAMFIFQMERNAMEAPEIELTPENWIAEFGEDGLVDTPVGQVKFGQNQYVKLQQMGRNGKLGMIKPTLTNPDVIIEDKRPSKNGSEERDFSYVFIKAFTGKGGKRMYYFTSVTVKKGGSEVVISNQEKSVNKISRLLQNGNVVWTNSLFSSHPTTRIEESVSLNDSNKPTSTDNQPALLGINSSELSVNKDSDKNVQSQEKQQKPFHEREKEDVFRELGEMYGEKMPHKVEVTAKALTEDLAKAQSALNKAQEALDNTPIGREAKAKEALDKARQEYDAVKIESDFWNGMDADIKAAQARRDEMLNPKLEVNMSEEPMDASEFVAQQLTNGNIALTSESFKKETGYGEDERRKFIKIIRRAENGGMTIEQAGERLMEMDRENGTNFFDQSDPNAGRDAIINMLGMARTWGDITNYIRNNRERQAEADAEGIRSEMEEAIWNAYHVTPEEYATMLEMEMQENPYEGVDLAALDAIFAEKEFGEEQKSEEYESGTDVEGNQGQSELLSEEQPGDTTGDQPGETVEQDEGIGGGTPVEGETPQAGSSVSRGVNVFAETERIDKEEQRRRPLRQRVKEWENLLGVKVNVIERPEDVKNREALRYMAQGYTPSGWVEDNGEVCIYLPGTPNVAEVDKTMIHEVVAHRGLPGLLGRERFNELCDKVWSMMPEAKRTEYYEYVGNRFRTEEERQRAAADEYMAFLAEDVDLTPQDKSVWKEIIKYIRSVIDSVMGKTDLTDADIEELLRASFARLVTYKQAVDASGEGARFSVKKDSDRRQKLKEYNDSIDQATAFVTGWDVKRAKQLRIDREQKRKEEAAEIYESVLKGDFNDVTLQKIDKYIEDATPFNSFGQRISQRLPQGLERSLREGARTNAVDALFSRICESSVPASRRASEAGRREIEERKKEALKGWAIATGNWHTDLSSFADEQDFIRQGTDSKVYLSKDGRYVIKTSFGKPFGKRFRPDIDNVALFNRVFPNSSYEIVGYGEFDGKFARILKQPFVDFADKTALNAEEREEYMRTLGFEPINDSNTAFSNGTIIAADLQKSNILKDASGNITVIDADMKLHTKDVGGNYTYPPVEADLPENNRFRVVNDKNGKKTLVGLHNISEDKLRKAIKQGGLANPSMAVIDMDKQQHVDYGDITLIAPESLVDKRTGKNVGTYMADAYTPIYPTVAKKISDKGAKAFTKALGAVDETFRSKVRTYFNSYLDNGTMYDALFYWYLSDTGKNPPILETALPEGFTREEIGKVKAVNPDAHGFFDLSDKEKLEVVNLYAERFYGSMDDYKKHLEEYTDKWESSAIDEVKFEMVRRSIQSNLRSIKEYGYEYDHVSGYYSRVMALAERQSKPSDVETFRNAYNEVVKSGLEEDFGNWLMSKEEELGVEEKLFAGYDNQGRAKYVPNTLLNASKLMKKEGRAGATGLGGFNYFVAILAPVAKNTKQISEKKQNLSTQEEYDKFAKKWGEYYHSLALQLQPGADKWADYGYHRLHEIAPMANPKDYVKKEYGLELSDKFIKDLNDVKNAIKNDFPARYFETKFERPVYLNEFAAAVVPGGTSEDIVSALSDAGLPVEQYESGNNDARMAAVDKVSSEIGGIHFRISDKGRKIQNEVDKFASKYNSKEVVLVDSEMTDEELEDAIPYSSAERTREEIFSGYPGGYSPNTDKIYIFVDNQELEDSENTMFHENLHPLFNNSAMVEEFYGNAKEDKKALIEALSEAYNESEIPNEMFAHMIARDLSKGNYKFAEKYLSEESRNELFNTLKEFGYDRSEEESIRRGQGNVRGNIQMDGKPQKAEQVDGGLREGKANQREELKRLFDQVANIGLDGVLGNKEYTNAMVEIYKAMPEDVRLKIDESASKNYQGNVAPAVSDYLNHAEASVWDKVVNIIREALRKIGFDVELNANDVKYILWRSQKKLDRRNVLDVAEDIDARRKFGATDAEDAVTRFRVMDEVNKKFNEELSALNEENADKVELNLGRPSAILRASGVEDKPMKLYGNKVIKKMKKHGFKLDELRDLPNAVADPIAVFDNLGRKGNRSILTELRTENGNFLVSVDLGKGEDIDFNIISSVFGKGEDNIVDWIERGFATYINKEKALNYLHHSALIAEALRGSRLDSATKIVESFENPKVGEGNVRFRTKVSNKAKVRDDYEAMTKKGSYQAREAVQDAMLSLRRFQELLEKATGKSIRGFENAWWHENRMSSMTQSAIHEMERKFYKPLTEAVKKLMKSANMSEYEVSDYLMLKHEIERNREMAVRKALTDSDGKIDKQRLADWYRDKRNVRNRQATPHLDTWRKQQEELDNIALLYGADMSRDYSGLTSMFDTDDLADCTEKAYNEVEALENAHPIEAEALEKAVKAMTQSSLDYAYKSGLMDQKVYDELSNDMYDYYIPLRGFDETTSDEVYAYMDNDRGAFNAPLRRAKGRSSKADNPIAYMKSIAESGIMQGNRNKMKQSFLAMVLNRPSDLISVKEGVWAVLNPATGEWEAASVPPIPNNSTPADVEAIMTNWDEQMEQRAQNDPNVRKITEADDIPYRVVGNRINQHQVIVKWNGRSYTLTVNGNPRLAMAINGLTNPNNTSNDSKVAADTQKAINNINRQLAAWYTTRNPDFVASNFMRDTFYTNTIVRAKEGNHYANHYHKHYARLLTPGTMVGLFNKWENGTLDMNKPIERDFHEFMVNGGETGYSNLKDMEEIKRQISKDLKGRRFENVEKVLEKLDLINRAVENTARFAAYRTSKQVGRTTERAIFDAKEISVNFNRKGSGGTFYRATGQTWFGNLAAAVGAGGRALYVFFNAAIQGTTNLMHVAKVNPKGTGAGCAAMFLMGAIVPMLLGGDDEKDYYDLPEHVRRNHLILPGLDDSWISIPLPIEYRIMYGAGELLTSWRTGHERGSDIGRKMLNLTGQALPLNFLEEGMDAFIPSAISPLWQVYKNRSWTGLPIYKDNEFNKDDPEYTKAYSNVDRGLYNFTKSLYEWTFDEKNQEEGINLNPAVIEHVAKGYFGGFFTMLSNVVKTGEMIAGERDFDWRNIPIANRALKTGDERTKEKRVTNEYFENMEKLEFLQSRERTLNKIYKGVAVPEEDKKKAKEDFEIMKGTEIYNKYMDFKEKKKNVDKIRKIIKEKGPSEELQKKLSIAQEEANKTVR